MNAKSLVPQLLLLVAGVIAPFLFPAYTFQIAMLWVMILFALTWDIMGGQMGYNSLGNIFFFGIACTALVLVFWYVWRWPKERSVHNPNEEAVIVSALE